MRKIRGETGEEFICLNEAVVPNVRQYRDTLIYICVRYAFLIVVCRLVFSSRHTHFASGTSSGAKFEHHDFPGSWCVFFDDALSEIRCVSWVVSM